MRGLWITAATSLVAGLLLLVAGFLSVADLLFFQAHGAIMLIGVVLMAIEALHFLTLERFRGEIRTDRRIIITALYATGTVAVALGSLFTGNFLLELLTMFGWAVLVAGSIVSLSVHLDLVPKRKESVVDVEKDPLTKGDDASWKHIKFAHFFLPLGLILISFPSFPTLSVQPWAVNLGVAGMHMVGIGFGLLSMYGLGHLWVPRFSGVPAIAAGAIKGELHSTLPSLILIPVGFAIDMRALIIAGGSFAFLGFFTYMGVLGANIMRNKSPTHRVTPEFVYVPWTFTGIFWLVSGVLMGIFLNAVPDLLRQFEPAMSGVHVHIALFGGIIQLIFGWLTRIVPKDAEPPRFTGIMTAAFYAFNAAVVGALFHLMGGNNVPGYFAVGFGVLALGLFARAMQGFLKSKKSPSF